MTRPDSRRPRGIVLLIVALTLGSALALASSPAAAETRADIVIDEEFPVTAPSEDGPNLQTVEVETIPPLVGVEVRIDDQVRTTGADGVARFRLVVVANIRQRIMVETPDVGSEEDGYLADYARLYRRDDRHYALAFNVHKPVTFSFHGSNGEEIGLSDIDATNLKNRLGGVYPDVALDRPLWLHAQRVVSTQQGPELRDIEWSIESVIVKDTNVVNRAQVRFFPAEVDHIEVPTLFFSATFRITDLFFKTTTGDAIELTHPDGEVTTHQLEDDGTINLPSLPRGEYHAVVLGPGPRISRPVALSRNQDLELELLSWLDLGVVAIGLVVFLALPLVFGRRLLRRRRRPPTPPPPDRTAESSAVPEKQERDERVLVDLRSAPVASAAPVPTPDPEGARQPVGGTTTVIDLTQFAAPNGQERRR